MQFSTSHMAMKSYKQPYYIAIVSIAVQLQEYTLVPRNMLSYFWDTVSIQYIVPSCVNMCNYHIKIAIICNGINMVEGLTHSQWP